MIKIKKLYIRNFLSYGDYDTEIDLSILGPTLIKGNNGAGKSTLIRAIQWVLFGKLGKIDKPGDKVINWDIKKNCIVKLTTKDGYTIIRTRKHESYDNHNDILIYDNNGQDISLGIKSDDLIKKTFNLDYDIFTSSIYFGQEELSFLELSDKKRRSTLERLLNIGSIAKYAQVAKEKHSSITQKQEKLISKKEMLEYDINNIKQKIQNSKNKNENYENEKEKEIQLIFNKIENEKIRNKNNKLDIMNDLKEIKNKLSNINKISDEDIAQCEFEWDKIKQLKDELEKINSNINDLKYNIRNHKKDISKIEERIKFFNDGKDTMCISCNQKIESKHVESQINELNNSVNNIYSTLKSEEEILSKKEKQKEKFENYIDQNKPEISLRELKSNKISLENKENSLKEKAKKLINRLKKCDDELLNRIEEFNDDIDKIKNKTNPYEDMINSYKDDLKSKNDLICEINNKIDHYDLLISHLKYIYDIYNNKKKIRSFILSSLISMLNSRIKYYIDMFNIGLDFEFDSFLSLKMSKWGYELCSGGQKKCIDLSIMFAIHDLHLSIHGEQCNIMIFDEVDAALDSEYIEIYSKILKEELIKDDNELDSVLAISHKKETWDSLSDQNTISIKMIDDLSFIDVSN